MAAADTLLIHPEEAADTTTTPHLSFSRINRYLLCPEQYRLYYIENLRPKLESASLVFGALVHRALADLFQNGVDPVQDFQDAWAALKDAPLRFSRKDSWQSLAKQGEVLLTKFFEEEAGQFKNITSIEKVFELNVSSLDMPFIGVIDLVAELRGKRSVIDFKTSQTKYAAHDGDLECHSQLQRSRRHCVNIA
ncbi:MAG: PD-(D/E)XK nuclease family protein [Acidobacteria bacterium]|nr:PD-(D/E)XK nuclease family protein [Acidobacteriota bacterium]